MGNIKPICENTKPMWENTKQRQGSALSLRENALYQQGNSKPICENTKQRQGSALSLRENAIQIQGNAILIQMKKYLFVETRHCLVSLIIALYQWGNILKMQDN